MGDLNGYPIVMINETFIEKLDSISQDIKIYININAYQDKVPGLQFMEHDDIQELLEIRKRVKILTRKLRDKYGI
jgi:hypothetical protein